MTTTGKERAPELLKWVGGKRRLTPILIPLLRKKLQPGKRYYEPFLGSAVVYLHLSAKLASLDGAKLSDKNPDLINFYLSLRMLGWKAVHDALLLLRNLPLTEETFQQVRADYNERRIVATYRINSMQAARFIYMNRVGFNGLWRTNQSGDCNTPYGFASAIPTYPAPYLLARAETLLQRASIHAEDFSTALAEVGAGDVVYCDPPYDATYDGYSGGFSDAEQAALADRLRLASEQGAYVLASNLDTPRVRALYGWATLTELTLAHTAGGKGTRRSLAPELLIQTPA